MILNLSTTHSPPPAAPVSPLPLPPRDLLDLFDVLEQSLAQRACGHGYSATLRFLLARGLPVPAVLGFLKAHGGHCDCGVLARVERAWWRAPAV